MIIVRITLADSDGEIKKEIVRTNESNYRFEVEKFFEGLGDEVAKLVDPS